ncbi:MAG: alpha/beta hydrolase [Bacteroidetes bacterium]|nr:alpha/beta hydrolase [Bacteroidota bacterium]
MTIAKEKVNCRFLFLTVCILSFSCQNTNNETTLKATSYTEHFIHGASVKLHYLDWGGSGEPLILIHGLGDSPFLFEELADALKKNFRVIAYSKRGHCKSEVFDSNFDNSTLVSDLKLLLDSLQIKKANLLGWSMGGNEITEFAIQYPERTNKLIYFEAGYDLSEDPFKLILHAVSNTAFADSSDLISMEAYRNWYHRFWFPDVDWNSTLESNLKACLQIKPDRSIKAIPNDEVSKNILKSAMTYHRNYDKVKAPALLFFTNSFFQAPGNDAKTTSFYEKLEKEIISPWRQSSINRVKTEMKKGQIITLSKGSHVSFIFLSKNEIVTSINSFLLEHNTNTL